MGKKYVIELENQPFADNRGNYLYRVKGFNSLVFDEEGLKRLKPVPERIDPMKRDFKVGDEVIGYGKDRGIVYRIDGDCLEGICDNTESFVTFHWEASKCEKTGRSFRIFTEMH